MVKNNKRDAIRAGRVQKTAEICQVSERHVRRVISGTHDNEYVMQTYMFLAEGENKLLQAAKKLVLTN